MKPILCITLLIACASISVARVIQHYNSVDDDQKSQLKQTENDKEIRLLSMEVDESSLDDAKKFIEKTLHDEAKRKEDEVEKEEVKGGKEEKNDNESEEQQDFKGIIEDENTKVADKRYGELAELKNERCILGTRVCNLHCIAKGKRYGRCKHGKCHCY